ncbi:hypothetical protein N9170_00650 [Akkermansiaceae bacterium]|nr:hypothetical protein [Akkermansiaceae bacterium]
MFSTSWKPAIARLTHATNSEQLIQAVLIRQGRFFMLSSPAMLIQFLAALGLLSLALGAFLGIAGVWVLWKHHKNGALFLGLILISIGVVVLLIASKISDSV